jgi:hypothetical protein
MPEQHRSRRIVSDVYRLDGGARLYVPMIPGWEIYAEQVRRRRRRSLTEPWRLRLLG